MARLVASLSVLGFIVAGLMCLASAQTTHNVGEDFGWQVPEKADFFQTWASQKKFSVGDKLFFKYTPGSNNVIQSAKAEFDVCTQQSPIETHYMGPTTIELTRPGDYYFMSSVGKHCEYGQKLQVTVSGAAGSAQPATRQLLSILSTPVEAPAPGPSAAAATTIGAASIVSGTLVALLL